MLDTRTHDGDDAPTDHEEDEMIKEGMKWRQPGSIPATVWALLGFVVGLVGIFELAGF